MAKTTASAKGTNRKRATPVRKNMGTKTILIESVETNAGMAICCALSRIAWCNSFPAANWRSAIFDFDRGIIHQDSHGQRESAEGHDVDGLAQSTEDQQRSQNRKRNRDGDDQSAAPTAQEQQNHERGEAGRDARLANDAGQRSAHENGLIEQGLNHELRR